MNAPSLWLLLLFPLLGSAACGALHLLNVRARRKGGTGPSVGLAGTIAVSAMAAAFGVALLSFFNLAGAEDGVVALTSPTWTWIHAGDLAVDVTLIADRLSSILLLVITGVGALIHVYATGYMKGDPGFAKFFCYLNLFVAAMLLLVLSSSLLGLFVGWEGVGLCSYLLIGFWYEKGWPAEAGQKAFVVNRIGDACFLIGSFLLFRVFGTLDIAAINGGVADLVASGFAERSTELTLAALLLFGGCCGKSAQFPLFTWLPDAMAGPTPVSALIHAATMVTSGIYLVVRLNPLFASVPAVLMVIGTVGALTALIGGSSALRQNDLKGVLAYSTVSQLGYMFLGLGTGAWAAAIFHLVTHAFFKALLFLGAGSVIHGMHEEQDMRKMGGLKTHMPRTFQVFLCGALALSGIPLMSGFFSKDEILAHAFGSGGFYLALWLVGIATAAMTAYYTWRMVALTFFGRERFDVHHVHPHESPPLMIRPLYVLAVLSVAGGILGLPPVLPFTHAIGAWLEPVTAVGTGILHGDHVPHLSHTAEWLLLGLGSVIALGAAHFGFHRYKEGPERDERLANARPALANFLGDAWTIDSTYKRLVVRPIMIAAHVIAVFVDQLGIDGAVNGAGRLAGKLARELRRTADGSVKTYALWMGGGAACLALVWILGGGA